MVCCLYTVSTHWLCLAALVLGALGTRLDPCPRHRGLPDGLTKAENKIKDRALYRLDLRNAIRGYTPNEIYRLRVHTTSRKHKYNDAVLVIDALDAECGPGRLIVDTDELYSPKDCPDVVTTQQKSPMGRSHFKWQAPTCGCVHIRVRVHSNSSYYLEDENTHNGPLARTVCPKDGFGRTPSPSPSPPEKETTDSTHHMSREQRLKQLCTESRPHTAEDVLKNKHFASKRDVTLANEFDKERLSIAIEQRRANIIQCCSKGDEMLECFGDVRRRRIDTFCGMGEPDIPFSKKRVDWIKQKETECCLQIGEDRYTCFNYTLYQETMLNDGRMDETEINSIDLDDFDPVNDIDDYKFASETEEDTRDGNKNPAKKTHNDAVRHFKLTDTTTEPPERVNRIEKTDTTEGGKDESDGKVDNEDEDDDDDDDDIERDVEQKDEIEHVTRDRVLSVQECCYNGITEGTKVAGEGFEGCFKSADRISTIFTTWTRKCDRSFVICCMRVVDGKSCVHCGTSEQISNDVHKLNTISSAKEETLVENEIVIGKDKHTNETAKNAEMLFPIILENKKAKQSDIFSDVTHQKPQRMIYKERRKESVRRHENLSIKQAKALAKQFKKRNTKSIARHAPMSSKLKRNLKRRKKENTIVKNHTLQIRNTIYKMIGSTNINGSKDDL